MENLLAYETKVGILWVRILAHLEMIAGKTQFGKAINAPRAFINNQLLQAVIFWACISFGSHTI